MSWLRGYSKPPEKPTEADSREEKRKRLEAERADRLFRAQRRAKQQKQLLEAQLAQQEADKACEELLAIDPDILSGEVVDFSEDEIQLILADDEVADQPLPEGTNMADFDQENGTDGDKAMEKLGQIQCPFDVNDLEFWFSELEGQLEMIEVKSQWLKRMALQKLIPLEIKEEVKALLRLSKTQAGTDIYYRSNKNCLMSLERNPKMTTFEPKIGS